MPNLTLDNNTQNRLPNNLPVPSFRARAGDDIRRSPRRFHPTVPAAPGPPQPMANPYSRRPSASSFISDVLAVRNDVQPPSPIIHLQNTPPKKTQHSRPPNSSAIQNIASQHHPARSAVLKRQAVKAPHTNSPPPSHIMPAPQHGAVVNKKVGKPSNKKRHLVLASMALMIFVTSTWVSFSAWQTLAIR